MPQPSRILADSLIGHLKSLELTRLKFELQFREGHIVRRDLEQVYSGLFLEAITSFEAFIEDLFIRLLISGSIRAPSHIVPKALFKSRSIAAQIVLGGQKYLDWLPYSFTERRAIAFFRNGLPFCSLDRPEKNSIEKWLLIRNVIAHKSKHAKKVFEEKLIEGIPLAPREKTPAGFLRSELRISPTLTRYQYYMLEMARVAQKLCS